MKLKSTGGAWSRCRRLAIVWAAVFLLGDGAGATAAPGLTTPREHFGFNPGDDHHLPNYRQLTNYWHRLERESSSLKVVPIGVTEEGRPMVMAVVSSPANLRRVEEYREIARRLALAENLSDNQAKALAGKGRVVVWISGGLHATETLGTVQLVETVYQLISRKDAETRRILESVIVLAVPANPDGMDLVGDWYMREADPAKRSLTNLPRLYQKYAGHDNNRDFYALTQSESKAMSRALFREWFPQIIYDHHQSGPPGTVMYAPPFRDPFNYRIDPRVQNGVEVLGAAMIQRFLAEGKPGVTVRSGARYSAWWNGGLRSIGYYHNAIGLLTETIGGPNPIEIPFHPALQLPRGDWLAPIEPQRWHFRQSVEYAVTANYAVLDYASRHRVELLWNHYAMGRDAIARGRRDHWTPSPSQVERAQAEIKQAQSRAAKTARPAAPSSSAKKAPRPAPPTPNDFVRFFRDPSHRDARGYLLASDQADFGTATRFVNMLIESGVRVLRATNAFDFENRPYPAGSFVVPCDQAYRAHVLDMFEPQDHPHDLQYPGGPPIPPYDLAGWTPAIQMNVKFDRVFTGLSGPFEICEDVQPLPVGRIDGAAGAEGFLLRADANDAFRAVNRLQAAGHPLGRLAEAVTLARGRFNAGTFHLPRRPDTLRLLQSLVIHLPVTFVGIQGAPPVPVVPLRPVRVGLWDRYGGSIASGWTRWVLEQFEMPFETVFAPRLDAGNLRDQFDVLVFVTGAIPAFRGVTNRPAASLEENDGADLQPPGPSQTQARAPARPPAQLPAEWRDRWGSVTPDRTIPQLRAFLEAGGTVLTIGSSTDLARHLGLPLASHLVSTNEDGREVPLPREKFYIPGSIVRVRVNAEHPLAWGAEEEVDVMFHSSPVFRLAAGAGAGDGDDGGVTADITRVAWFDQTAPLRSGWALGQQYLQNGIAIAEVRVGAGCLLLFGPEIVFRAQSHGTFKFLFNGILNAGAVWPRGEPLAGE
ncbi:MAG TPA: M14 family metallopeptidase [Verrucomicrobiota bacterium]|nr:M14 family metallopeptidase [Verrucomicrobiota bacterium]HRT56024.1 M14 family metallopeptidase [Candidatus Paceibacterota bacterium]